MKRRIFITGATGFVGCHLRNLLSQSEYSEFEVFGAFFPDISPHAEKNLFFLDITKERDVEELIQKIKPHWIFHLAAVSNVRSSWTKRKETLETNIIGTYHLFEAVRKYSPQTRILFISSSDVYGICTQPGKVLGEDEPVQVANPYAFSKAAGELLCSFYAEVENIDIVIARPFPHTGPGQSSDFVCSDWARQLVEIERGERESVFRVGNLDVIRDFTDVRDVVRGYLLLMEKGRRGEVYNVCSGRGVSLREILEILLRHISSMTKAKKGTGTLFDVKNIQIQVDPTKLRKVDIPYLVGKNEKIKALTGWKPQIPLEQTLLDLLDFWHKKGDSPFFIC